MPDQWQRIVELFVLPPGGIILLLVICLLLVRNMKFLLFIATASFYLLTTPFATHHLFKQLEVYPALTPQDVIDSGAKSILVLSASQRHHAAEYNNSDIVSSLSITRLRYAAYLQKQTGLPIIISGGKMESDTIALADLAAKSLRSEFAINGPILIENKSKTTAENLLNSAVIIKQNNLSPTLLVTHAWHMPRAVLSAEQAQLDVIPAPTSFYARGLWGNSKDWMPIAGNLSKNYFAIHEIVGRWWYQLKDITAPFIDQTFPSDPTPK